MNEKGSRMNDQGNEWDSMRVGDRVARIVTNEQKSGWALACWPRVRSYNGTPSL